MENETIDNFFSVIIPLYNKRDYVRRSINSALTQAYDNYEIIVVDDGSTDGSLEEVENIKDSKIRIIRQSNAGCSAARNAGVKNSKYSYIAFLDADDFWHPGLLNELNSLINRFPDAGIYGVNTVFEHANRARIFEKYDGLFQNDKSGIINNYFEIFSRYGRSPFCQSGCCYPKKIITEVGGYKEGIRLTEDSDIWCRIAFRYDIAYSTEPLVTNCESAGNTALLFESRDFEVSITLQKALMSNMIKPELVKSANNLIALQQLYLVKRAIITGHPFFAMKKLMDRNLFSFYPLKASSLLIIAILPTRVVQTIRRLVAK
jgi:glycosyltransferase involved in cell wall biosynthesis